MKVMIDTNIIISAALSPNGNAAKAFMKAVLPPYEPVVCDYIVDELHRKFQEKFPRKTTELEAFLYNAMQVIKTVPTPDNEVDDEGKIRDVKDRPILRAARKAKVSLLLTGDLDFLESDITDALWNKESQPFKVLNSGLCQLVTANCVFP